MAGIYIHIPFCKQKCSYCDFHFSTTYAEYRDRMIQAIISEIHIRANHLEDRLLETIYFGGGTPSLLSSEELQFILDTIKSNFKVVKDAEITLEANPDDINDESLETWKANGINRLSIGLQSFREKDLKWMNRAHTVEESLNCVALAQAHGFDNLTVDLIYGLPDLSMQEWENHVQKVIEMNVPHISAYCLTVEPKTALNSWVKKGIIKTGSEDDQSDQFIRLLDIMEENGYVQYEISNYCKVNFHSKHNSNYWKGEWYLGIGPSAHSYNGSERTWNIANNQTYMNNLENEIEFFETETLSEIDKFNETILIGLRTITGVNLKNLNEEYRSSNEFIMNCERFQSKAWMLRIGDTLTLTKEGKLRADYIASELFLVQD
ncbi:MAG: radical SAM family heme chaperone HemW [Crocinitomicaceae bacterium]|nr:radical SAM family heme chaperone HemW [Crocinitomicaceae bacterium]